MCGSWCACGLMCGLWFYVWCSVDCAVFVMWFSVWFWCMGFVVVVLCSFYVSVECVLCCVMLQCVCNGFSLCCSVVFSCVLLCVGCIVWGMVFLCVLQCDVSICVVVGGL